MKLLFGIFGLVLCAFAAVAQTDSVEREFEKNKAKYKLEAFAEGEDASSGFDYLYYKNKSEIVKLREIWSSSAETTYRAVDYFYKNGRFVALVRYTFPKKYYKTSISGANVPFKTTEKLYFTDSKLTRWIENGKEVPATDARWAAAEKNALESGIYYLENYSLLKEVN